MLEVEAMTLSEEEIKQDIRRALNENYVLKPKGYTDEDCMVDDIYSIIWRLNQADIAVHTAAIVEWRKKELRYIKALLPG